MLCCQQVIYQARHQGNQDDLSPSFMGPPYSCLSQVRVARYSLAGLLRASFVGDASTIARRGFGCMRAQDLKVNTVLRPPEPAESCRTIYVYWNMK